MSIEIMKLVTFISVAFGVFSIVWNFQRGSRADIRSETLKIANMDGKLDNVLMGINELKVKLNTMEQDQKDSRERIIILEQKVGTIFKRIDEINVNIGAHPTSQGGKQE